MTMLNGYRYPHRLQKQNLISGFYASVVILFVIGTPPTEQSETSIVPSDSSSAKTTVKPHMLNLK